ncbi:hypothetical protein GCM10011369_02520 [Neiella marina]|uniref:Uncharacterized protein n=1 Tax=Neiella marina TaxID=508461 RepID=A0A8J2U1W4_9GAMM|nr:hypothetical protein [Neiella marina]GGA64633.1 hypothetical protein GCM10011369_02520 [Neiella marina]
MKWLADNARFTLLYKHLSNRASANETEIPKHWQAKLAAELDQANKQAWRQRNGRQKLLHLCEKHSQFGAAGLQPRHWLRALRYLERYPVKFGHVIIIAILLLGITLIHTDYLLLEVNRQFEAESQAMPTLSHWLLNNGMLIAYLLVALAIAISIGLKLQYQTLIRGLRGLNLHSHWLGPYSVSHMNTAVSIFLLSKLPQPELANHLAPQDQKRIQQLSHQHELSFMAQDKDCAELLLHQHVHAALHANTRLQKVLAYVSYLLMAAWFCTLMLGMSQAFLDWGKLGL